jgi:hypothetical protein
MSVELDVGVSREMPRRFRRLRRGCDFAGANPYISQQVPPQLVMAISLA